MPSPTVVAAALVVRPDGPGSRSFAEVRKEAGDSFEVGIRSVGQDGAESWAPDSQGLPRSEAFERYRSIVEQYLGKEMTRSVLGDERLRRRCTLCGTTFEPRRPDTTICFGCYHEASVRAAEEAYRPLSEAIRDWCGLDSWVWQSGGMTMTLVTGPGRADPDRGARFLTLVEEFLDDGRFAGSTGFYLGDEETGLDVVDALFDPLDAEAWASRIAEAWAAHVASQ